MLVIPWIHYGGGGGGFLDFDVDFGGLDEDAASIGGEEQEVQDFYHGRLSKSYEVVLSAYG